MKNVLLTIVFMVVSLKASSQHREIDSLRAALKSSVNNEDAININSNLAWRFVSVHNYDSALIHYNEALRIPLTEKDVSWRGNIHLGIGTVFSSLDEWDSAFIHYEKALSIFESISDTANLAIVYGNLAILYKYKNLYEEALLPALSALTVLEKGPPSFGLGSCYNLVGSIHKAIRNYSEAEDYYRKSLSIRLKINQPLEVAKSYNNLGELFILAQRYDSATTNLKKSIEIKRQHNDNKGYAHSLASLGKVSMLTGDLSLAESQLLESLTTQREIHDNVGMIETLNNLGELYSITNRLDEANRSLLEANKLIHASGTPDYLRQNLELRITLARKQKDFVTGMNLQDELLTIRDSLLNEEKSKSLQAMQIRYETQKKEQEIALLEQREEISKARIAGNRILIGALVTGLILVAAIGLLIHSNLKNARAGKQRIELLLSETRHRMKNHLQTLASIFHLQTRHYTNHEMVLEAKSSESRVHTMSLLHDKFFTNEIDQVINARDYISDLVHKLVDVYGSQTKNLRLTLDIEDVELDIDRAFALSLIIQELVCNTFKYAFDHEPNPELLIDIHQKDDNVHAMIHDNGIGLGGNSFGTSQGLNLVDALVSQLDGDMHIDNNRGTTFIIRFPARSLWKKPAFS